MKPEEAAAYAAKHPHNCLGCDQPRVPDLKSTKPGEIHFLPCAGCGTVGVVEPNAPPAEVARRKKAVRDLYQNSRYRGGKLVKPV